MVCFGKYGSVFHPLVNVEFKINKFLSVGVIPRAHFRAKVRHSQPAEGIFFEEKTTWIQIPILALKVEQGSS